MTAINFSFNKEKIYYKLIDNTIFLYDKKTNKIVYTFPFPKGYNIMGMTNNYLSNEYKTFIITPYIIQKPKIQDPEITNLHIGIDGAWHAEYLGFPISYIDTSFLKPEDYEYTTLGNYKVSGKDIPSPFWMVEMLYWPEGWHRFSNLNQYISSKLEKYGPNARSITEDELIALYATNDYKMEFWENMPENIYDFFEEPDKYYLNANITGMDNWDIVCTSKECKELYRIIYREQTRDFHEKFWYRNKSTAELSQDGEKQNSFHMVPIIDFGPKLNRKL